MSFSRVSLRALSSIAVRSTAPRVATAGSRMLSSSAVRSERSGVMFASGLALAGAMGVSSGVYVMCDGGKWTENDVKNEIIKLIENEEERRGDGTSIAPTLVRLAWHAAGTYSMHDKSGGSTGCRMRFNPEAGWGANAGLATARAALDPIQKKFPGLSYADLYTFAGAVAVEQMGGPVIPFRFGRPDFNDGTTSPPDGRLPNADCGSPQATALHLRAIFNRMGFNDQQIVALSGAHALGRCHEDASGYWGPWTRAETTFSNEYYRLLMEEKWTTKKKHNGQQWVGPNQLEDKTGELMMLPSDIVLTQDPAFKPWVEKYAKDEDLFFKDFASAFGTLLELGVDFNAGKKAEGGSSGGLFGKLLGR